MSHPGLVPDSQGLLYRAVFEQAGAGMARLDFDGAFLEVNSLFCRLVGFSRDALMGMNIAEVAGKDHEETGEALGGFEDLVAGEVDARTSQVLCARNGAGEAWVHFTTSVLRREDGSSWCLLTVAKDISALKEVEQQAQHLAFFDSLTDLPNRRMLIDRLNRSLALAQREKFGVGVLFLDLDRFKQVNDVFGHETGDLLLIEVARRLSGTLRKVDTVARLGGDEFVVVLHRISQKCGAQQAADKILAALSGPITIHGRTLHTGSSIGIACYPSDGADSETLLMRADAAMYAAKAQGRGTCRFFCEELNRTLSEKSMLEEQLRSGEARAQMFVVYQPQVDLQEGRLVGVEALLRWQHPELGLLLPGRFIPLAEETGMIVSVGQWLMEQACCQVQSWRQEFGVDLRLTLNVSGKQLGGGNFSDDLDRILATSGFPVEKLELDLNESTLMNPTPETLMALTDLRVRGVRIAIDHFGTGYSSLAYLQNFPVDRVKIAPSFLRGFSANVGQAPIAEAIIGIAHRLKIAAYAEGIENEHQRIFLLSRGCDEGQGQYFAPPLSDQSLNRLLAGHTAPIVLPRAFWQNAAVAAGS